MDTSAQLSPCIGCGGSFQVIEGPVHRYMESSPGCWQAYGEVLAREYNDRAFWGAHRLTSDTYAVQHPGRPSSRQAIQSVAVHLISLSLVLGQGKGNEYAMRVMAEAIKVKHQFTWLTPPASMGPITVADVRKASGPTEHARLVRQWAESSWDAWRAHHDTIRLWTPRDE